MLYDFRSLGKKVKLSRYKPWWRLEGQEVCLLLILDLGTRWGERSELQHGSVLDPRNYPHYLLFRRLEGGGGRTGLDVETGEKYPLPLPGIGPRSSSPQSDTVLTRITQSLVAI
jgi:hypothetical protein